MADFQNSLKFINFEGLQAFATKLKTVLTGIENAAKINDFKAEAEADKVTISLTQGESAAKPVSIDLAGNGKAGLMSAAEKTKLEGIAAGAQVNVIEGVVVRAESDTDSAIEMTQIVDKKIIIDNLASIAATAPTETNAAQKDAKMAPTAKAVRDYVKTVETSLDGKISNVADVVGDAEGGLVKDLATVNGTLSTHNGRISALETTVGGEDSGLVKKVADLEATVGGSGTTSVSSRLDALETFQNQTVPGTYLAKTDAESTYLTKEDAKAEYDTISSVNSKIEAAKKAILTGDATEAIDTAYDTLKEVADWIASNDEATDAGNIVTQLNDHETRIGAAESSITNLKTTVGDANSGLVKDVETLKSTTATTSQLNKALEDYYKKTETYTKTEVDGLITGANTDAKNKADQALADAKTYTNQEIGKLAYVTEISQLNAKSDGSLYVTYKTATNATGVEVALGQIAQEAEILALFD